MHKTPAEWLKVRAEAVTSGSVAQATNVLQMALDDIAVLAQINANLMGDDENVPRYTTKRLKQELCNRHGDLIEALRAIQFSVDGRSSPDSPEAWVCPYCFGADDHHLDCIVGTALAKAEASK